MPTTNYSGYDALNDLLAQLQRMHRQDIVDYISQNFDTSSIFVSTTSQFETSVVDNFCEQLETACQAEDCHFFLSEFIKAASDNESTDVYAYTYFRGLLPKPNIDIANLNSNTPSSPDSIWKKISNFIKSIFNIIWNYLKTNSDTNIPDSGSPVLSTELIANTLTSDTDELRVHQELLNAIKNQYSIPSEIIYNSFECPVTNDDLLTHESDEVRKTDLIRAFKTGSEADFNRLKDCTKGTDFNQKAMSFPLYENLFTQEDPSFYTTWQSIQSNEISHNDSQVEIKLTLLNFNFKGCVRDNFIVTKHLIFSTGDDQPRLTVFLHVSGDCSHSGPIQAFINKEKTPDSNRAAEHLVT